MCVCAIVNVFVLGKLQKRVVRMFDVVFVCHILKVCEIIVTLLIGKPQACASQIFESWRKINKK